MNKLVSIISPCYNGEKFVGKFLDSIYNQTYTHLEIIIINDGSIDRTDQIIKSYKKRFEKKGISLIYIEQINSGQSAAINKGLEIFKGDYMTWLDSDDILTKDAIEKKVAYMEDNPDIGLLISKVLLVEDKTFKPLGVQERIRPDGDDHFFKDLIIGDNVFYTPGGYFVRSSMFRSVMPNPPKIQSPREIGQNFQLLLPISYKYHVGYIDDVTYFYRVRLASHSHIKHSYVEQMRIVEITKELLCNIAKDIEADEKQRKQILKWIDVRITILKLQTIYRYKKHENIADLKFFLIKENYYNNSMKFLVLQIEYPLLRLLFEILGKIKFCMKTIYFMIKSVSLNSK